ncbi:MAG: hypothetical protein HOV67_22060 [Kribbellaceae bacterium]|nr:hypothetical protein [Kribbellaceae bacterium]
MSYEPLPIIEVRIADLYLDLDNYRIPTRPDDEAAALNYLFVSEDVLGQAKLIIRNGYFDNEVPIVVADGAAYVVLEGNRRVSALKALRDPTIVPDHEHEVRALLNRYALEAEGLPAMIRVLVAPSREAAGPHIARLHTGLSKKRWSRDQQANYYYSLLSAHTTVDDLKALYPGVEVVRFIKMVEMRRFLVGVKFTDPSLHAYVTSSALTMSAFEYAYRNVAIAAAMGATFDKEGHLLPRSKTADKIGAGLSRLERDAVEHLMIGFRSERFNTRSAEFRKNDPKQLELIETLTGVPRTQEASAGPDLRPGKDPLDGRLAPPPTRPSGDPGLPPAVPGGPPTPSSGSPRGPNHPMTKDKLQLGDLDYNTHTSINLQRRYQELRKLSLNETPAAAAMMLRSVFETTIKLHFEPTKTSAVGQLAEVFKVVASTYGSSKALRHTINAISSGGTDKQGSIQWFNVLVHSVDIDVQREDVHKALALISPVLRLLLRPADPNL